MFLAAPPLARICASFQDTISVEGFWIHAHPDVLELLFPELAACFRLVEPDSAKTPRAPVF